jgi:hypothetical protein
LIFNKARQGDHSMKKMISMNGALLATALLALALTAMPENAQAQGDQSRHSICASFGRYANYWDVRAKGFGCKFRRSQPNEASYYRWCMRTSDASFRSRSPTAQGHKDILNKFCARQLRRPFLLSQQNGGSLLL